MRFGVFLFFGGWVVVMTLFVIFFLPETKGVRNEDMMALFETNWVWRRMMGPPPQSVLDAIERAHAEATGTVTKNGAAIASAN